MTTTTKKVTPSKAKAKTPAKKMSISSFKPKEYRLEILSPVDFTPTGGYITLVGQYSPQFAEATRNMLATGDANDAQDEQLKSMAKCVTGWCEEFFEAEFTYDNVLAAFRSPELKWVVTQCDLAIGNSKLFF